MTALDRFCPHLTGVRLRGLEPRTYGLKGHCAAHSYSFSFHWLQQVASLACRSACRDFPTSNCLVPLAPVLLGLAELVARFPRLPASTQRAILLLAGLIPEVFLPEEPSTPGQAFSSRRQGNNGRTFPARSNPYLRQQAKESQPCIAAFSRPEDRSFPPGTSFPEENFPT